jgi:hypothetical protein
MVQKKKVKFVSRRGNAESENLNLWQTEVLEVAAELQNISCYDLQRHFERIIKKVHRKDQDIYIYVLIDPRDLEVRYVGKTNNPKERLRAHVSPHVYMRTNNLKCIWTEELKALGLKPIMSILCKCKESESENYEYRYFKLFNYGSNLLNSATIQKETFQFELKL